MVLVSYTDAIRVYWHQYGYFKIIFEKRTITAANYVYCKFSGLPFWVRTPCEHSNSPGHFRHAVPRSSAIIVSYQIKRNTIGCYRFHSIILETRFKTRRRRLRHTRTKQLTVSLRSNPPFCFIFEKITFFLKESIQLYLIFVFKMKHSKIKLFLPADKVIPWWLLQKNKKNHNV